ncbi:hypothetical protein GQ54DRAFT_74830 [Martensiomyces pterosporus]|nr:hypothetical protein GQ54DRAFT_74830 [Martensiomyces pterosporus]
MYSEIEQLLAQIHSETGETLVEHMHSKGQDVLTGVGPIDQALEELQAAEGKSSSESIIELLGLPGSGKTQTLYRICATIAMPRTVERHTDATAPGATKAVNVGGYGLHVVFVDADGKLDVFLLRRYIYGLASDAIRADSSLQLAEEEIDRLASDAVGGALSRIHIFTPRTTHSLVATLALLPKYLAERSIAAPGALLIDGVGSNYWIDRREGSLIRMQSRRATPWFRLQQLFVDTLQQVQRKLACLAVVANVLILRRHSSAGNARRPQSPGAEGGQQRVVVAQQREYRDHMIPRWQNILARSFVLEASAVVGRLGERLTAVAFTPAEGQQQGQRQRQRQAVYIGDLGLRNAMSQ